MAAVIRWRHALVMALPFLVVLNGVPIRVGGVALHLDQLAACLLLVPLGASALVGARRLRADSTVWWLGALLVANIVASVFNSPARSYSLLQCVNLASVWVIYLLVLNFVERDDLERFFHRCLWAALAASVIGITAYLLNVAGVPVGGAEVSESAAERLTNAYGAYGTMVEPNIFGSFSAAYLVISVVLLAAAVRVISAPRDVRLLRWVAAATAAGLVFSFTRAAWLGALVGLGLFVALSRRMLGIKIRLRGVFVSLGVAVAAAAVLWVLPGSAGDLFRFKVDNLVNIASPTAFLRLVSYGIALQQTADHPVVGYGTFSFAALTLQGADFQRFDNWHNLWIGNYLLLALHDTGVIGLVLWTALIAGILVRGFRAVRRLRAVDSGLTARTLALAVGIATLLVPFLATTGFTLGYTWLLIGLLGAHCRAASV